MLADRLADALTANTELRAQRDELAKRLKDIDDLKERLAVSEAECQRMRGYIARVQEDDVVREELVKTGDADGECQLVPKRKPTSFTSADPYQMPGHVMGYRPQAPKRRHWVTY